MTVMKTSLCQIWPAGCYASSATVCWYFEIRFNSTHLEGRVSGEHTFPHHPCGLWLAPLQRGWGVAANSTGLWAGPFCSSREVNERSHWAVSQTWAAMLRLPQWAWLYYHWALSNYTLPARQGETESILGRGSGKVTKYPGLAQGTHQGK